ncbi:MAG: porin family protein [Deltaproteobacteria bacterium]|nr:porin family protein [Deltaproteobacteria bacterium]
MQKNHLSVACSMAILILALPSLSLAQDEQSVEITQSTPKVEAPKKQERKIQKKIETAIERVNGRVGFGFFTGNAPLGARYWLNTIVGLDAGFGMNVHEVRDVESSDPKDTTPVFDFAMELGVPLAVYSARNLIIYARPGMTLIRKYRTGTDKNNQEKYDDDVTLEFNGMLGAELFLSALGLPSVSLQGGIGLALGWLFPADQGGSSHSQFSMGTIKTDLGVLINAQLGFHVYF